MGLRRGTVAELGHARLLHVLGDVEVVLHVDLNILDGGRRVGAVARCGGDAEYWALWDA